jgi:hypothetical protein
MPLSRYAEGGLLNPLFQNAGGFGLLSNEPETYIALMTAVPNKDGTGGTEANYGGYARVNATGEWAGVQAGEAMDLTGDVEFPRATSGNNVVTHMAIYDANTSLATCWRSRASGRPSPSPSVCGRCFGSAICQLILPTAPKVRSGRTRCTPAGFRSVARP